MKAGSFKSTLIAVGCTAAGVLAWVPLLYGWKAILPEPQGPPVCVKCGGPEAPPKGRREAVFIEAVWSQYAWTGTRVDIVWTRNPLAPEGECHYELIAEDVLVLASEGDGLSPEGGPTERITVDVTAGQAERLRSALGVGWLRALARPMADTTKD